MTRSVPLRSTPPGTTRARRTPHANRRRRAGPPTRRSSGIRERRRRPPARRRRAARRRASLTPPTVERLVRDESGVEDRGELLVGEDGPAGDEDERDVTRPRGKERRTERHEVRGRAGVQGRGGQPEPPRGHGRDGGGSRASDTRPVARAAASSSRSVPAPLTSASVPSSTSRPAPKSAREAVAPYRNALDVGHHTAAHPARVRRAEAVGVRRDEVDRRQGPPEEPARIRVRDLFARPAARPSARCIAQGPEGATSGASRTDCAVGRRGTRTGKSLLEVFLPRVVVDGSGRGAEDILQRAEEERLAARERMAPFEILRETFVEVAAPRRGVGVGRLSETREMVAVEVIVRVHEPGPERRAVEVERRRPPGPDRRRRGRSRRRARRCVTRRSLTARTSAREGAAARVACVAVELSGPLVEGRTPADAEPAAGRTTARRRARPSRGRRPRGRRARRV